MPSNVTRKVLENHLVEGRLLPGEEIAVRIDHNLCKSQPEPCAMLEFNPWVWRR